MRKALSSASTIFALLLLVLSVGSAPAAADDSSLAAEAARLRELGKDGQPHDVSAAYEKALILKYTGRMDIVSRTMQRVSVRSFRTTNERFPDVYSDQWGGYISQMTTEQVRGLWADSYVSRSCTGFCDFAPLVGSWVGIGGVGNKQLLQVGVSQRSGFAFYEALPGTAVWMFDVNDGDSTYYYIAWDTSTSMWYVFAQDVTLSRSASFEVSYSPDLTTADWITEVQQNYDGIPDGATPVAFVNPLWMDWSTSTHRIDQAATAWREILRKPSGVCIVPTGLDGNGSFTNFRYSSC
ncbi:MAG: hypothetical protein E6I18_02945 [Chloroflexi bacterium]|nr:MAG: hypothetical protein E6I18_02945 [Chloroflexota bacterium]